MKKSLKLHARWLVVFSMYSLPSQPYEALDESDLSGISANSGLGILNIYGSPSAGLSTDNRVSKSDINFGLNLETTKGRTLTVSDLIRGELEPDEASNIKESTSVANKQIQLIEERKQFTNTSSIPPHFDESQIEKEIEDSKQRVLLNQSPNPNNSNSETRYKEGNHKIVMRELENNVVQVIHDVVIDLIKIENLSFDDNNTSFGNIYLSNVTAHTDTKTFIHK